MERPPGDVAVDDADDDEFEDDEPRASESLREAADQLLRRAGKLRFDAGSGQDVEDRLLALLSRIGEIDYRRSDHTSILDDDEPEPADEWEREHREETTRAFLFWCSDQLAEAAVVAIEYATAVYDAIKPDYQKRADILAEMRDELLDELAMESESLKRWGELEPSKREVSHEVMIALGSIAHELAIAAYHWRQGRWPGEAGLTGVEIAAKLLAHGERIAQASGHGAWPPTDANDY